MYAALASQKRHMAVYLTNVYGDGSVESWFRERYLATGKRLDMGKSCVRFRKLDDLPLELVGEVIGRTPIEEFVEVYRRSREATPVEIAHDTNALIPLLTLSFPRRTNNMTAPKQFPYKRRPRKSDKKRRHNRAPHVIPAGPAPYPDTGAGTQGKQSTQNP